MAKTVFVVSASSADGGVPGSTFHVVPAVFESDIGAIAHIVQQGEVTDRTTTKDVPLGIFTVKAPNVAGGEPYIENFALREIEVPP
jgi:hypothetical protein